MKILQINNYNTTNGRANIYYNELCKLLKQKAEVLQCYAGSPGSFSSSSDYILRELNISSPSMDALRYFYRPNARKDFREYLVRNRPDLAHVHIFQGQVSWSLLQELKSLEIPIVQTLHDLKVVCPTGYAIRNNEFCTSCLMSSKNCIQFTCNRGKILRSIHSAIDFQIGRYFDYPEIVNHFICVSNYQKKIVSKIIDVDRSTVIHNFSKTVSAAQSSERLLDEDYLLYPTRLVEKKGVEELIQIYKADQSKILPRVVIAGDGEFRKRFEDSVIKSSLSDRIYFWGHSTGQELSKLYLDCICVLNLSQLNETFGLTSIEAFSHGRPIIVSKNGALPEIVDNYDKGLVISNFDNIIAVKDEIIDYLSKISMNSNALYLTQHHYDHFSPENHLGKLFEVYKKVIYS